MTRYTGITDLNTLMKKQGIDSITPFAIIIIIIGILTVCEKAMGQEIASSSNTENAPQFAGRDQWNLCKEMWLKDKRAPEDTYTWRKITIKEVSVFGGFYAKGYVNNDILFPVHIIPNLDKIDIATLRQQLKEGSVVDIVGKCDGVTENNKVIIEVDEVNLYE